MADPTATAYARVNSIRQARPRQAQALALAGVEIVPNVDYENKIEIWSTIRDCFDGERTIKEAGEIYLPRLSAHKDADYATYRGRAYFYNAVRRTHKGLMGSLFRKPVEFTLPAGMASKLDLNNITQDKQSAQSFCRTLGHEVLLTGRFGILTDFKDANWQKPYLAGYLAENIYAWRETKYKDREVVDRVVLLENEIVNGTYGFTNQLLVRVLRLDPDPTSPGELVYSQDEIRPASTEQGSAGVVKNIPISVRGGRKLRYIPFVIANAVDTSTRVGVAPLEDIAWINISHYKSTAHLEHGRFYAGMPTYVTSGSDAGSTPVPGTNVDPLTVGPQFVWELEENAKAWLLEFTGHGLTFLENAVDSKQLQMQSLGGRLISSTRRAAAMSDEAWQLLETGDEATLMDVAVTADEAMGKALAYMGDMMGEIPDLTKSGVLAEFNKEFVRSELTARELRALQALAERAHIPQDVMYYALREVGVIPVEITLEDFQAMMKKKEQIWQPPPQRDPITGEIIPLPPVDPTGKPGVRPQVPPRPANNGPPGD